MRDIHGWLLISRYPPALTWHRCANYSWWFVAVFNSSSHVQAIRTASTRPAYPVQSWEPATSWQIIVLMNGGAGHLPKRPLTSRLTHKILPGTSEQTQHFGSSRARYRLFELTAMTATDIA